MIKSGTQFEALRRSARIEVLDELHGGRGYAVQNVETGRIWRTTESTILREYRRVR